MFKNTRFLSKTTFDLSFSNLFRRPKWPNAREFNDTDTWQYFANETQLPCAPIWPPKDPHANNNVNVHHHHHRSHQASTTAPWCAPTYDNPPHTLWTTLSDVLSAKGGMRNILNNMFEPTALAKNTKQKCCQKKNNWKSIALAPEPVYFWSPSISVIYHPIYSICETYGGAGNRENGFADPPQFLICVISSLYLQLIPWIVVPLCRRHLTHTNSHCEILTDVCWDLQQHIKFWCQWHHQRSHSPKTPL